MLANSDKGAKLSDSQSESESEELDEEEERDKLPEDSSELLDDESLEESSELLKEKSRINVDLAREEDVRLVICLLDVGIVINVKLSVSVFNRVTVN